MYFLSELHNLKYFFSASHSTFSSGNMLPIRADLISKYLCLSTLNTVVSCFIFQAWNSSEAFALKTLNCANGTAKGNT